VSVVSDVRLLDAPDTEAPTSRAIAERPATSPNLHLRPVATGFRELNIAVS
jgi:hypothetical protein